ncbi:MAG TPA: VIT and VWA domain-containing protein [Caldilineaceae bacterium]|nr:VIT and VWA domain-containing protein [Caldilineaceae bacterium]
MFNPAIYENSQPDGFPVLEVVDRIVTEEAVPRQHLFIPLLRTALRGNIFGPLADLHLTQTFQFNRAAHADAIEALYRFPLPGDAAVVTVTVRFGAVEIVAELKERATAEAEYATAKNEGRQAALATREAPDLFTLQVAGLQPDEPITVETHYLQLARPDHRLDTGAFSWSLRIPLTTAPRYVRADECDTRAAQAQPLWLLRDPGHRFTLDLTVEGTTDIQSPTHPLSVTTMAADAVRDRAFNEEAQRVQLAGGAVIPDRDCLLLWSPPQAVSTSLSLLTHYAAMQKQLYFLALVSPPQQPPLTLPKREVILLVDHSGSMRGPKWAAADWAVERFLRDLQPTDTFALATFHYETHWFAKEGQPATAATVECAVQWLRAQQESGGTELGVALEQALLLPRQAAAPESVLARNVLIVTDAAVSDAPRLLRLASAEAQHPDRRRISVLCIDAAPNAFLAHELAERSGGIARFLTSDPEQIDIVTALDDVLAAWGQPLLVDLKLAVSQPEVRVSGHAALCTDHSDDTTVVDLGNLTAGQPQWLVGMVPLTLAFPTEEPLTFTLSAASSAAAPLAAAQINLAHLFADRSAAAENPARTVALKALYGARLVNALAYLMNAGLEDAQVIEQLKRLGYDPATLPLTQQSDNAPILYAENRRQHAADLIRPLLVEAALDYGLASSETAFVATRKERGERVTTTVAVANALPAGWSDEFMGHAHRTPAPAPGGMAGVLPSFAQRAPTPAAGLARGGSARLAQGAMAFAADPSTTSFVATSLDRGSTSRSERIWYDLFHGLPGHITGVGGAPPVSSVVAGAGAATVLFDSQHAPHSALPDTLMITAVRLQFDRAAPAQLQTLMAQPRLTLSIYIGDLIVPRATVRLGDLLRAAKRPLNLRRDRGQQLVITLRDPTTSLQSNNVAFSLQLQGQAV